MYAACGCMSNLLICAPLVSHSPCQIYILFLSCTITSVAVNVTVHPLLQIFPIPMRLLVNCGMICPVHACCSSWEVFNSAVAIDVISFLLATLTVIGGAVLSILETDAVVVKKSPLASVSAIAVQVLGMV